MVHGWEAARVWKQVEMTKVTVIHPDLPLRCGIWYNATMGLKTYWHRPGAAVSRVSASKPAVTVLKHVDVLKGQADGELRAWNHQLDLPYLST